MAKRDSGKKSRTAKKPSASRARKAAGNEGRLVTLAEQLGRVVGTVHGKAKGWTDLATGVARRKPSARRRTQATAKLRSGGVVDAPGKKHRKPLPADPDASLAKSQAAKVRAAGTRVKTPPRRGRG